MNANYLVSGVLLTLILNIFLNLFHFFNTDLYRSFHFNLKALSHSDSYCPSGHMGVLIEGSARSPFGFSRSGKPISSIYHMLGHSFQWLACNTSLLQLPWRMTADHPVLMRTLFKISFSAFCSVN